MKRGQVVYIYTITCPVENIVVYVGMTRNIERRIYGHYNNKVHPISIWINSIVKDGQDPIFSIIDNTIEGHCQLEKRYIDYYKSIGQSKFNRKCGVKIGNNNSIIQ